MRRATLSLFAMLFLLFSASPAVAEGIVESFEKGRIDWSSGEVIASGLHAPTRKGDESITPDEQSHFEKRAVRAARANLSTILRRLTIQGNIMGRDAIGNNSDILAQLDLIFLSTPVVSKKFLTDGSVEVAIALPLKGPFSQLILPEEIRQINPITPIAQTGDEKATPTPSTYTGLVVDARGVAVTPALAPRVVTETGEEVYGPTVISREHAVQRGVAIYVPSFSASGKSGSAGENPLVVTGIGTVQGTTTDVVISSADAAKLRSDPGHTAFLSQCRVVFVVDAPKPVAP